MNASVNIITNLFVYLTMWLTSCSYTILHYLYLQEILTCKYSIAKILRFYEFKTYKVKYCNSLVNTHLKAIERSVITFQHMYYNHLWLKKRKHFAITFDPHTCLNLFSLTSTEVIYLNIPTIFCSRCDAILINVWILQC